MKPIGGAVQATQEMRGRSVGRYEILETLGQGGMGVVYKAMDPHLDRIVALKTPRADLGLPAEEHARFNRRFYREAMAAGRLKHPSIVAIHDVMEIGDTPYIVMEHVEGETLAEVIAREAPLDPSLVVAMAGQVLGALECSHAQGVVHRDIKPGNILVGADGTIKVGDFGIARIGGIETTQTAGALGTPAYISPEQVRGCEADGRSDLFSVAVMLYEALCGERPFSGKNFTEVLYQIAHVEPRPLRERNPTVPPALEAVIQRALAKEPDARYPDARALGEALREAVGASPDPPTLQEHGSPHELGPSRWRPRWIGILAAGHLLAGLMVLAAIWMMPAGEDPRPSRAVPSREGNAKLAAPKPAPAGGETPGAPPALRREGPTPARPRAAPEVAGASRQDAGGHGRKPAVPTHDSRQRDLQPMAIPPVERPVAASGDAPRPAPAPPEVRPAASLPGPVPQHEARAPAVATPASPPAPPRSDATGCLSVNATPFASVFVDGKRAGETPKACLRVPVGERRVHFEAEDDRSPQRVVRVTAEHTAENPLSVGYDFRAKRYLDR